MTESESEKLSKEEENGKQQQKLKTLVLFVHPDDTASVRNKNIKQLLNKLENIFIRDIKNIFKSGNILLPEQIIQEQKILLQYDRIVFQYPVYWFGIPGLGKQYIDQIFREGFAYSLKKEENDYKLRGKYFKLIMTTGGKKEMYKEPQKLYSSMKDTAEYMKMNWEEPFIFYRDDEESKLEELQKQL